MDINGEYGEPFGCLRVLCSRICDVSVNQARIAPVDYKRTSVYDPGRLGETHSWMKAACGPLQSKCAVGSGR